MRHPTVQLMDEPKEEEKPVKKPTIRFALEDTPKRDEMVRLDLKSSVYISILQRNPYWIEANEENRDKCPLLVQAPRVDIDPTELKFWNDMIAKYLKPLYENKDEKKKV